MTRAGRSSRGFTLLELLVVVVIIGIILSFAALGLPGGADRQLSREAERLHALLRLAAEEAVLNNRELGLRLGADGYEFYTFTDAQWQPVAGDAELRRRELPPGLRLELEVEGRPAETAERPQIVLYASGEITPFQGLMSAEEQAGAAYRISADAAGRLALERIEHDH